MKTKRIWLWSFIFGIFAAGLVYYIFYSTAATPVSSTEDLDQDVEEELEEENREITEEEEEIIRFNNTTFEISGGKRAISLEVGHLYEGVSGYIEPNSYIDIIAFDSNIDEDGKEYLNAELILQRVLVLTVGASSQSVEDSVNYITVTIEVTPEEGVFLSLAEKHEEGFYFMLRNSDDEGIEEDIIRFSAEVLKEEDND